MVVILGVLDAVFRQLRRSNGQFASMRTTQFLNLLGLIAIVVLSLAFFTIL